MMVFKELAFSYFEIVAVMEVGHLGLPSRKNLPLSCEGCTELTGFHH